VRKRSSTIEVFLKTLAAMLLGYLVANLLYYIAHTLLALLRSVGYF